MCSRSDLLSSFGSANVVVRVLCFFFCLDFDKRQQGANTFAEMSRSNEALKHGRSGGGGAAAALVIACRSPTCPQS